MNRHLKQTFIIKNWVLLLLLSCCFLISAITVSAETTVTNTVHVTANGGENHAAVTTVINGEVVEDWSTTSTKPIIYSTSKTSSSTMNTTKISTAPSQAINRDHLKELITKLQALISLYVSLLNN